MDSVPYLAIVIILDEATKYESKCPWKKNYFPDLKHDLCRTDALFIFCRLRTVCKLWNEILIEDAFIFKKSHLFFNDRRCGVIDSKTYTSHPLTLYSKKQCPFGPKDPSIKTKIIHAWTIYNDVPDPLILNRFLPISNFGLILIAVLSRKNPAPTPIDYFKMERLSTVILSNKRSLCVFLLTPYNQI